YGSFLFFCQESVSWLVDYCYIGSITSSNVSVDCSLYRSWGNHLTLFYCQAITVLTFQETICYWRSTSCCYECFFVKRAKHVNVVQCWPLFVISSNENICNEWIVSILEEYQ